MLLENLLLFLVKLLIFVFSVFCRKLMKLELCEKEVLIRVMLGNWLLFSRLLRLLLFLVVVFCFVVVVLVKMVVVMFFGVGC